MGDGGRHNGAQPVTHLLAVLAVYRVAHMVVAEDGPADLFVYGRGWVYERFGVESWVWRGVACIACVSFWLSWVAALALPGPYVLNALGVAGAVLVLHKVLSVLSLRG